MRQGGALGIFYVLQEATSRAQPARGIFNAKANQIAGAELQIQLLASGINFEFPQRTAAQLRRPSISDISAKSSA